MQRRRTNEIDPRDYQLSGDARTGYTYFVMRTADGGFKWVLADRNGETLCRSDTFADKGECLKRLRAVQRHAGTTHALDETT